MRNYDNKRPVRKGPVGVPQTHRSFLFTFYPQGYP